MLAGPPIEMHAHLTTKGRCKGGLRPPFRNPPLQAGGGRPPPPDPLLLVRDVGGASGASLRARSRLPGSREDQLTHRAEPVLAATLGSFDVTEHGTWNVYMDATSGPHHNIQAVEGAHGRVAAARGAIRLGIREIGRAHV